MNKDNIFSVCMIRQSCNSPNNQQKKTILSQIKNPAYLFVY
jgi:hypothetical protein